MPTVRWLWRRPWLHSCKPVARLLYAPPDVGPAGVSHLVARPGWYRRVPRALQGRPEGRPIRAAGAAWLKPRLENVPIPTGRAIVSVAAPGEQPAAPLNDGRGRRVRH